MYMMTVEHLISLLESISDKNQLIYVCSDSDISDATNNISVIEVGVNSCSAPRGVYITT